MTNQYLRKWSLILTAGGKALDLSQLHIRFKVDQADVNSPNTAVIRAYNLKDSTAKAVEQEYQKVTLQAGYQDGAYGVIFQGSIKQIKRGRESATDTFVEIMAADGDEAYNFAMTNQTLAAGSSYKDRIEAAAKATAQYGVTYDPNEGTPVGGVLPRGRVLFGLARATLGDTAQTAQSTWTIQNGKIVITPLTGYQPGEIVVLTARTGLIGIPEATINGLECQCLLNPLIQPGRRIQLDNKAINQTTVREVGFPRYTDISYFATVSNDGVYRVIVHDLEGDSRGNEWYSKLVCLALDPSATPNNSVKEFG